MTEMLTKTEKQIKFDQWLEALRSGNYIQAEGALRIKDQDVLTYCCVGVLDELIYNTDWHKPEGDDDLDYIVYADDVGESTMMSPDRVIDMDLDKELNEKELDFFEKLGFPVAGPVTRIGMLATVNDGGHTFESIADYIEELGWNV